MNPGSLFYNRETKLLRSGWRATLFTIILISPQLVMASFMARTGAEGDTVFEVNLVMIATYVLIILWVVFVSWLCLRFLDRMPLASLGYDFRPGWWREGLKGVGLATAMIVAVVVIQAIGGGTRVIPNAIWWKSGRIDFGGLLTAGSEAFAALVLLILAGAFEELIYRGYPFQTLLRGAPAAVPILLLSILFGLAHWDNPNRTFFSTANTILAGVWLAMAYLKTRRLWFPTALHFSWNWDMGALFGIPVSGLSIPRHPLFISSSQEPLWLTGGIYGAEGGAAATIVLIIAIFFIFKMKPAHHS